MSSDHLLHPALAFTEAASQATLQPTLSHRQGSCSYLSPGPGVGSVCPSLSLLFLVPTLKKA